MERVLEEIKALNEQLSRQRQQRTVFEDEINETQFDRSKLEQKVHAMKNKQITDEVKLEQNLKSELENRKLQLE